MLSCNYKDKQRVIVNVCLCLSKKLIFKKVNYTSIYQEKYFYIFFYKKNISILNSLTFQVNISNKQIIKVSKLFKKKH
jgi:hypothetical protein